MRVLRRARALGRRSAGRAAALAAAFALVPLLPREEPSTEQWLTIGLVAALAGLVALAVVVLALAREIGMLRLSVAPRGALEVAHEGPEIGARSALAAAFERAGPAGSGSRCSPPTAAGCAGCWRPPSPRSATTRRGAEDVRRGRATPTRGRRPTCPAARSRSRSTPTAPCWPRARSTRGAQLESVLAAARAAPRSRARVTRDGATDRRRGRGASSRRGFLARVGAAAMSVAGRQLARSAPARPRPTTSAATSTRRTRARTRRGCRGSTPRASRSRPATGGRSTTSGRYVDAARHPGRRRRQRRSPTPTARRCRRPRGRRVCDAAGDVYGFTPHVDGAWYRCCGGRVRKLVDCCGTMRQPRQRRPRAERLLLPRPQGVLRHVLRHERQVLTRSWSSPRSSAGVTGAWSPCGFSMVETLAPARLRRAAADDRDRLRDVRRRRARRRGRHLRRARAARRRARRERARVAAAVALAAAVGEARGARIVPQVRRQVPESWRRVMPVPLAAGLYGDPARARLHDVHPHASPCGRWPGSASRSATRRSASPIGLAFGAGRALPVIALAPPAAAGCTRRWPSGRGSCARCASLDALALAVCAAALLAAPAQAAVSVAAIGFADPSVAGPTLALHRPGGTGELRGPAGVRADARQPSGGRRRPDGLDRGRRRRRRRRDRDRRARRRRRRGLRHLGRLARRRRALRRAAERPRGPAAGRHRQRSGARRWAATCSCSTSTAGSRPSTSPPACARCCAARRARSCAAPRCSTTGSPT